MYKAQIITRWLESPFSRTAEVAVFLMNGQSTMDVTGQDTESLPPEPNSVIWEFWGDLVTINLIGSDPDNHVLWFEEEATP